MWVFNRQITQQKQLTVKLGKVKTKRQHTVRLISTNRKSVQTKDSAQSHQKSTRLTTITRFTVIDKLMNGLILPPKLFVTPIPPHFSLYILFCMCLISPTKRTTPAQAQQCRFAFVPRLFWWDSGIHKKALPSSCLQVVFDIHCPAAVLTTWIRSEQNAAFWKTACSWRETDDCLLELNKWLSSSQALVHGWCYQMGNLWMCPLGADGSHFPPTLALLCL